MKTKTENRKDYILKHATLHPTDATSANISSVELPIVWSKDKDKFAWDDYDEDKNIIADLLDEWGKDNIVRVEMFVSYMDEPQQGYNLFMPVQVWKDEGLFLREMLKTIDGEGLVKISTCSSFDNDIHEFPKFIKDCNGKWWFNQHLINDLI